MVTEAQRVAARERKRLQRARERQGQIRETAADDDPADPSSEQLLPAGIVQGGGSGPTLGLMEEQAIWVRKRRELTELELARRRGEVVSREESARQAAALCRRIRAALDRAPSLLPGDLSVENQTACRKAMAAAIAQALAVMP